VTNARRNEWIGTVVVASPPSRWAMALPALSFSPALLLLLFCGNCTRRETVMYAQADKTQAPELDFPQLRDNSALVASYPSTHERAKLTSDRLAEVLDVETVPLSCKTAFAQLTGETHFSLANPKQPYQAADALALGPQLPWRRLIFGGVTHDRCVIYYEIGGFSTTYAAVILNIANDGAPSFVWGGVDGGNVRDFPELLSRINGGAFMRGGSHDW